MTDQPTEPNGDEGVSDLTLNTVLAKLPSNQTREDREVFCRRSREERALWETQQQKTAARAAAKASGEPPEEPLTPKMEEMLLRVPEKWRPVPESVSEANRTLKGLVSRGKVETSEDADTEQPRRQWRVKPTKDGSQADEG